MDYCRHKVRRLPSPCTWQTHSERQIYLSSLFSQSIGTGPALTCSASIPDLHHYSGRGAKDTIPLYRTQDASEANILPGLLEILEEVYKLKVTNEDFLAYVYGVLAQPLFAARYANELDTYQLRVPLTKDAALFERVRSIGARLLWLHTYGERFVPLDHTAGHIPPGTTKCNKAVTSTPKGSKDPNGYPETFRYDKKKQTLLVGDGEFAPVREDVYEFEVSGLKVMKSWLKYRMKEGAGKKSSSS